MAENNKQTVNANDDNVLLRVENLSQHFGELKAVDNVSFDIKKGEVFGLVGESGCGKTTTGRSIIKLYNITSGSIYFKGQRIGAGTLSYKNAIKNANENFKKEVDELKKSSASVTLSISKPNCWNLFLFSSIHFAFSTSEPSALNCVCNPL